VFSCFVYVIYFNGMPSCCSVTLDKKILNLWTGNFSIFIVIVFFCLVDVIVMFFCFLDKKIKKNIYGIIV